jgi:hypothetical protein
MDNDACGSCSSNNNAYSSSSSSSSCFIITLPSQNKPQGRRLLLCNPPPSPIPRNIILPPPPHSIRPNRYLHPTASYPWLLYLPFKHVTCFFTCLSSDSPSSVSGCHWDHLPRPVRHFPPFSPPPRQQTAEHFASVRSGILIGPPPTSCIHSTTCIQIQLEFSIITRDSAPAPSVSYDTIEGGRHINHNHNTINGSYICSERFGI